MQKGNLRATLVNSSTKRNGKTLINWKLSNNTKPVQCDFKCNSFLTKKSLTKESKFWSLILIKTGI